MAVCVTDLCEVTFEHIITLNINPQSAKFMKVHLEMGWVDL